MATENRSWGYDRLAGAMAHRATTSVIRRWAISSSAGAYHQPQNAGRRPPGKHLSARTWMCCGRNTTTVRPHEFFDRTTAG
jgi:hypothetical protein